jgi:hypothetical protein
MAEPPGHKGLVTVNVKVKAEQQDAAFAYKVYNFF